MGITQGTEAIKEVKNLLDNYRCPSCGRKKGDLNITDVPRETRKLWNEFANSDEFRCGNNKGGHWGFAIKFLLDFYLGRINDGLDEVDAKVETALEEVTELKAEINQPKKDTIELVSGKRIER